MKLTENRHTGCRAGRNTRRGRLITALLLIMVLTAVFGAESVCAQTIDLDKTDCSIDLVMHYKDANGQEQNMDGGALTLYTIGIADSGDRGYYYDYSQGVFSGEQGIDKLGQSIENDALTKYNRELAAAFEKASKGKKGITAPIKNGKASFKDLRPGIYLIAQTEASDKDMVISSFLITIPKEGENGELEYNISGLPKPGVFVPAEDEDKPVPPEEETIPFTGQLWLPVPILIISGVILIILGQKRKRHERSEA